MPEKDAIDAIDEALAELRAVNVSRENALNELKCAVRRARAKGYPVAALAQRTGYNRNTITTWCTKP